MAIGGIVEVWYSSTEAGIQWVERQVKLHFMGSLAKQFAMWFMNALLPLLTIEGANRPMEGDALLDHSLTAFPIALQTV